jgi:hypothetical protein
MDHYWIVSAAEARQACAPPGQWNRLRLPFQAVDSTVQMSGSSKAHLRERVGLRPQTSSARSDAATEHWVPTRAKRVAEIAHRLVDVGDLGKCLFENQFGSSEHRFAGGSSRYDARAMGFIGDREFFLRRRCGNQMKPLDYKSTIGGVGPSLRKTETSRGSELTANRQ